MYAAPINEDCHDQSTTQCRLASDGQLSCDDANNDENMYKLTVGGILIPCSIPYYPIMLLPYYPITLLPYYTMTLLPYNPIPCTLYPIPYNMLHPIAYTA